MLIEENKVYNCDCLELMQEMVKQGIKADWLITDPPYGININNNMGRRKGDKHSNYSKTYWDNETPTKEVFDLMFKCSKNQIIFGANYFMSKMPYDSKCWIVWDKMFSPDVSFASCELAWTSADCVVKKYTMSSNQQDRIHATQKPLSLIQKIMYDFTKENDLILDCFMGSFTTAVACHKMQRRFIGAELDKEYFDLGSKRLQAVQSQLSMFDI